MEKEIKEENNISKKLIETDKVVINYDEETGTKIVNEFMFKETIGRGSYSKVKKCIELNSQKEFAVKITKNYLLRKKKKAFDKTNEGSLLIHYMIEDALNEIKTYKVIEGNEEGKEIKCIVQNWLKSPMFLVSERDLVEKRYEDRRS